MDQQFQEHFLIRRTPSKNNQNPITGKLDDQFLITQTDHLRDLSTNLIGTFLVGDIYWEIKKGDNKEYFLSIWVENETVFAPIYPEEVSLNIESGYFFLKIEDIHDKEIFFDDATQANPICKVMHTPTKSNFWHFSIRWFFNGIELVQWSKAIKNRMKTFSKSLIIEKAFFEEPLYHSLDPKEYLKNNF